MKKSIFMTAILFGALGTGAAMADDDDCNVPMADWQPRAAVEKKAETQGWAVQRIKTDDGCYQIRGKDKDGRAFKAKIDPGTLEIVKMKYAKNREKESHHKDRNEMTSPAGAAAPSDNDLVNKKVSPKVEIQ